MSKTPLKVVQRNRRRRGARKQMLGLPDRPRLAVFRSNQHIYAQVIDDLSGRTLASASSNEKGSKAPNGSNAEAAKQVGTSIAERATGAGIKTVVFDRGGFRYHGRVKALADAAREGGLKF